MKRGLALVLGVLLVSAAACGADNQESASENPTPAVTAARSVPTPAPTAIAAAQPVLPVTVPDRDGRDVTVTDVSRLIVLNGDLTEIVYALGLGENVVAVDTSATYPPEAKKLPSIGYQRTLGAEAILAQRPTLILGTENAGPPAVIEQLRGAGVPVLLMKYQPGLESVAPKIRAVATALGVPARGETLAAQTQHELDAATTLAATVASKPKVAFLNLRGASTQQIWGKGTVADAVLTAAGAQNAGVLAGIDGSKPVTAEALVTAAPDILLVTSTALESVGGIDGLLTVPGVAQTPAGRNRRVLNFEDQYLLGGGPRTGQSLLELVKALHPDLR
jgi:iron complex transport system substrate-binding protein